MFSIQIRAQRHGFVTAIDLDKITTAIKPFGDEAEVSLPVCIGTFVTYGSVLAEVSSQGKQAGDEVKQTIEQAFRLERQRDITTDPAYGIHELETIAWTSVSTAKSNPSPGVLALYSLQDVAARWSRSSASPPKAQTLPIVYSDSVFDRLIATFESIAVVASESMQHQTLAVVIDSWAALYPSLAPTQKIQVEQTILRSLSALGEHVLTLQLETALTQLGRVLEGNGAQSVAAQVKLAHKGFQKSIGKLGSRSTRTG